MELLQKWAEPIHFGISRGLEKLKFPIILQLDSTRMVRK